MGDVSAPGADPFELRAALRAAAGGSGSVHLIAGEPAIGKSRLAREIAAEADRGGFAVGWGRT